jgi:hybrid cluster-associated redox disulfide protein
VIDLIKKTDTLGDIVSNYPEVVPILAGAGLHCIGCHVATYESLEEGCTAHGMNKKEIVELVKKANTRIAEYEIMPKVVFTTNAVLELSKRLGKPPKKFVRIIHNFSGEFDFEASNTKEKTDEVIEAKVIDAKPQSEKISSKKTKLLNINILADKRIEKMLRGVEIDYDAKQKDFAAKRV